MSTIEHTCEECGASIAGDDLGAFGDAYIVHVRTDHTDWPFPDVAIRNYAEATQRLAPVGERVEQLGDVEVHRVTEDRIDDWLAFFDRDAFAGNPAWAACYCTEPHLYVKGTPPDKAEYRTWQRNRELGVELLRDGRSYGYLAYVDGKPGGWVNASKRSDYALYREGDGGDVPDADVIGVSCFVIAPPYRRHGLAARLLDQVIADAPARDAQWIEAYPFAEAEAGNDMANFRGPRAIYEERGFAEVGVGEGGRHVVLRRRV